MNTKNNIKKIIPIAIIGLSIAITFILAILRTDEEKKEISKYVPNVKSFFLESKEFRLYAESEGHIKPKTIYPLTLDSPGEIVFLSSYFNNNLIFNKGDTLLRIDSTDYAILRVNAKFKLDEAKLEFLRQEAISSRSANELDQYSSGVNTNELARNKPQLEKARSLFNAAEANYRKAELDLNETILLAPFNGRIIESKANLGQNINLNMNLGIIYSIDEMIIKLALPIDDMILLGLEKGSSATENILIELYSEIGNLDYRINATYLGSSGSIDKLSQKINITALVDDFLKLDIPVDNNVFFNAKIYGPSYNSVFSIPNIAIHNNSYVHIIKDNKIFKRDIEILKKYDDISIIRSGLVNGEVINLTSLPYYVEGMKVNVVTKR